MRKRFGPRDWIGLLVMAALLALMVAPVLAGEKGKQEEKYEICDAPAKECIEYMWKKMKSSGWVGVELSYDKKTKYYAIERVLADSPAEEGGLKAGDLVLAMNEISIRGLTGADLGKVFSQWKPGDSVTYTIRREGSEREIGTLEIGMTLAPMPAHVLARYIGEHLRKHHPDEVADRK